MSRPIIEVENLGKRYTIRHERHAGGHRYRRLSEELWDAVRRPFRRANGAGDGPSVEEFWALKNVSFTVEEGEVLGIIGRNGAGKSTLLKILSRITEPSEGRVVIRGRVASLLEVGTGFHPELTGRENIYLNGAILGMSRAEIDRKFDEIVAFAEVEKFLDTPVKRYSSGMYVRLAFAVAAHLEPEILVVDEVLAVGDAEFQKRCLGKMGEVAKSGRTVLFVSHNMGAVQRLCQRGLVLCDGELSYIGPVRSAVNLAIGDTVPSDLSVSRSDGKISIRVLNFEMNDSDIRFAISVDGPIEEPRIGVGIHLRSRDGLPICTWRPLKANLVVYPFRGHCISSFVVKGIVPFLSAGEYVIDLWFVVPNVGIIANFPHIGTFKIEINDFFGYGYSQTLEDDGPVNFPISFDFCSGSALRTVTA